MVVAKTDLAHRRLGAAIAARRVRRTYAALAWGHLDAEPDRDRGAGRPASHATASAWRSLADGPAGPDRRLRRGAVRGGATSSGSSSTPAGPIRSGSTWSTSGTRSWAIRSTAAAGAGGSPGPARRAAEALERATPRQALHAAALAFRHPVSGSPLDFRSEWPADLRAALLAAGGEELVAQPDPLRYLLFFNRDG